MPASNGLETGFEPLGGRGRLLDVLDAKRNVGIRPLERSVGSQPFDSVRVLLEVGDPDLGRRHEPLIGLLFGREDADVLELPDRVQRRDRPLRSLFLGGRQRGRRQSAPSTRSQQPHGTSTFNHLLVSMWTARGGNNSILPGDFGFRRIPSMWAGRRQTWVPSRSVKYSRLSEGCRACPSAQMA